ncbi:MAG TPA: hypothetical protein VE224_08860, partial [Pseudolabrys sp.]|nr:hypothetical protein [Pseudolabrys sp.]
DVGRGGAGDAVLTGGSGIGQPGPPIWLVRNKIDLLQQAAHGDGPNKNESGISGLPRSEPEVSTAARNEFGDLFNSSAGPMVSQGLTARNESRIRKNETEFSVSAASGEGVDLLLQALSARATAFLAGSEAVLVTRERHRHLLEETLAALRRAQAPGLAGQEDLLAEELRLAAHSLGRLTGRVDVEDILDVIFRDFCVGK